jgi:CubicO group peptidase (beta-lactamase class C family)
MHSRGEQDLDGAILSKMGVSVPGLYFAVVKPSSVVWIGGIEDLRKSVPASPMTVYMWSSMTKIVAATEAYLTLMISSLALDDGKEGLTLTAEV